MSTSPYELCQLTVVSNGKLWYLSPNGVCGYPISYSIEKMLQIIEEENIMVKQWTEKTRAESNAQICGASVIEYPKCATIRVFQGKRGKYYSTRENGIYYDCHFPVEWALFHAGETGPENCGNCKTYGSLNGVFVHYCMDCVDIYGRKRGGINESISDTTEDRLWREFPYMTGVYLSEIGNDPVKRLPPGVRYAELTVIVNKKDAEDMYYLLHGNRYPIQMPFKDIALLSRLPPPKARMTDPFICGSDYDIKTIYLYQGRLGQYYTIGEVTRPLYDIHFPVEWALNHKNNAKGYGSGPSCCGMCSYYGSINKVFVLYCDDCLEIYGGKRGGIIDSDRMTEQDLWQHFPYMAGVRFFEIGDEMEFDKD